MKNVYFGLIIIGFLFVGCGSSSDNYDENIQDNKIIITSVKDVKEEEEQANSNQKNETILQSILNPIIEYKFDMCKIDDHTIKGDAKLTKSMLNSALRLDGDDDFIKLPVVKLEGVDGFSFMAWVSFDQKANSGKNWETIFSFGNDDSGKGYEDKHKNEIWLNRYYKENKLYFAFTNGDRDNPCADVKTVKDVIKPNTLQHIAVTIDADNYPHIYIDSKEVEIEVAWHSRGGACDLSSVKRDLCYIGKPNDEWIGLDKDGGHKDHKDNNFLKGVVDEVLIFDKALDKKEIADIYTSQKNGLNLDKTKREPLSCEDDHNSSTKPKPTTKPSNIQIKIDANSSDWVDIDGVSEGDLSIKTFMDSEFVYFLLESKNIKDITAIWFIDADNNPLTGHKAVEWDESGADFAIGGAGKLYIANSDDDKWDWDDQSLDEASGFASKDGVIEVKVKKSDFNISDSYRVGTRIDIQKEDTVALPSSSFLLLPQ